MKAFVRKDTINSDNPVFGAVDLWNFDIESTKSEDLPTLMYDDGDRLQDIVNNKGNENWQLVDVKLTII